MDGQIVYLVQKLRPPGLSDEGLLRTLRAWRNYLEVRRQKPLSAQAEEALANLAANNADTQVAIEEVVGADLYTKEELEQEIGLLKECGEFLRRSIIMNAAVDQVIGEVKRSRSPGATREGGDGAEKEGDALYCPFQDSEVADEPAPCEALDLLGDQTGRVRRRIVQVRDAREQLRVEEPDPLHLSAVAEFYQVPRQAEACAHHGTVGGGHGT